MFRRRKACASEYKANSFAIVNERSQGSLKATQRLFRVATVKNIQASFGFSLAYSPFALRANIDCARCEKYSSKLDIFRSLIAIFAKSKQRNYGKQQQNRKHKPRG
ncbi:MAG: hypothetical protein IJA04_08110 [Bacteroidaceae bacterium]|nr:hypothetical protein [Bacteroidaceae bacterium]